MFLTAKRTYIWHYRAVLQQQNYGNKINLKVLQKTAQARWLPKGLETLL